MINPDDLLFCKICSSYVIPSESLNHQFTAEHKRKIKNKIEKLSWIESIITKISKNDYELTTELDELIEGNQFLEYTMSMESKDNIRKTLMDYLLDLKIDKLNYIKAYRTLKEIELSKSIGDGEGFP